MSLPDAIDNIRPAVVQVRVFGEDAYDPVDKKANSVLTATVGTGFLVNEDAYVITASHVIEDGMGILNLAKAKNQRILVGLATENSDNVRGNFSLTDCTVIDTDQRHDLALLKTTLNPFKNEMSSGMIIGDRGIPLLHGTLVLGPKRPREGTEVAISGYPLESAVLVTNSGSMATVWESQMNPPLARWLASTWLPIELSDFYLADVEVNPGNSGGPVYTVEDRRVVGMCSASKLSPVRDQEDNPVTVAHHELQYSSGLTIVIPSKYIIELLAKHSVSWR